MYWSIIAFKRYLTRQEFWSQLILIHIFYEDNFKSFFNYLIIKKKKIEQQYNNTIFLYSYWVLWLYFFTLFYFYQESLNAQIKSVGL